MIISIITNCVWQKFKQTIQCRILIVCVLRNRIYHRVFTRAYFSNPGISDRKLKSLFQDRFFALQSNSRVNLFTIFNFRPTRCRRFYKNTDCFSFCELLKSKEQWPYSKFINYPINLKLIKIAQYYYQTSCIVFSTWIEILKLFNLLQESLAIR